MKRRLEDRAEMSEAEDRSSESEDFDEEEEEEEDYDDEEEEEEEEDYGYGLEFKEEEKTFTAFTSEELQAMSFMHEKRPRNQPSTLVQFRTEAKVVNVDWEKYEDDLWMQTILKQEVRLRTLFFEFPNVDSEQMLHALLEKFQEDPAFECLVLFLPKDAKTFDLLILRALLKHLHVDKICIVGQGPVKVIITDYGGKRMQFLLIFTKNFLKRRRRRCSFPPSHVYWLFQCHV
jgi:hypothetical protein